MEAERSNVRRCSRALASDNAVGGNRREGEWVDHDNGRYTIHEKKVCIPGGTDAHGASPTGGVVDSDERRILYCQGMGCKRVGPSMHGGIAS